jgi:hypothetical protein
VHVLGIGTCGETEQEVVRASGEVFVLRYKCGGSHKLLIDKNQPRGEVDNYSPGTGKQLPYQSWSSQHTISNLHVSLVFSNQEHAASTCCTLHVLLPSIDE